MLSDDIKDPKHLEMLNEMLKKMNEAREIFNQNKLELKLYIQDLYNFPEGKNKKRKIIVSYIDIKNNIFSDSNFIDDFDDSTLMDNIEEYIAELGFTVVLIDGKYYVYKFDADRALKIYSLIFGLFPVIFTIFVIMMLTKIF